MLPDTAWLPFGINTRRPTRRPAARMRCNRNFFPSNQNTHTAPALPDALIFTSSSHLFRGGAFFRYTRRIRRLFNHFNFLHQFAFVILFLALLLTSLVSFLAFPASRSASQRISFAHRAPSVSTSPRHDMPSHLPSYHHAHHRHLQALPSSASPLRYPNTSATQPPSSSSSHPSTTTSSSSSTTPTIVDLPTAWTSTSPTAIATAHENTTIATRTEDNLIKSETNLTTLPHTTWYNYADLHSFRPPRRLATEARLITLNNACYCTRRNKFLLPKRRKRPHSKPHFPPFVFRYGAAHAVPFTSPRRLLLKSDQKVVHISGTSILWRGRPLHTPHVHLHRSLVPIRTLIDIIYKTASLRHDVKLVAHSFSPLDGSAAPGDVLKLHNYYFGDIPLANRISLSRLHPRLVCFRRVFALGSEYENHASSAEAYEHVKDLIAVEEKGVLHKPLVKFCSSQQANMDTVWLMNRQTELSSAGLIDNMAEVQTTINHVLLRLEMTATVRTRVIQAPNLVCPQGTAREGCYELDCHAVRANAAGGECQQSHNALHEATAFNNMTFLITTTGPANEALAYMPRGSQVVEIVPYGVLDRTYQQAAEDARLTYYRVDGKLTKEMEQNLYERFGDIARSRQECWNDFDCRAARLNQPTHVNVRQLRSVLDKALFVWRTGCGGES